MTDVSALTDEELHERALMLRRLGTAGDQDAKFAAQACVTEARRRFTHVQTLAADLEQMQPASKRPWWQFW